MEWLILSLLFVFVLLLLTWQISNLLSIRLGAPAISSPRHQLWRELANRDKTILDLGCGSGTVCVALAPYFKNVYGIEATPFYYAVARWRTRKLKNVTIIRENFFGHAWPKTDYIYCYLLPGLLTKLGPAFDKSGATVLSYGFAIPGQTSSRVISEYGRTLHIYEAH